MNATTDRHALTSKTVWMALLAPVLAKAAEFFGITPEQLYDYVLYGFPALMLVARQITAGGLRWIPKPLRDRIDNLKDAWWPDA